MEFNNCGLLILRNGLPKRPKHKASKIVDLPAPLLPMMSVFGDLCKLISVKFCPVDKKFFQGLPSPAAGSLMAGFIWLADDNKIPVRDTAIPWITFFIAVYAGLTMVSNARFYSGKALDVRYRVPFGVMVLLILTFVLISSNPPLTLFGLFVIYSISGYIVWAWERLSGKRFS
jgi:phosphatidylserine synthase